MTLNEALARVRTASATATPAAGMFLACGFQPMHLATFLKAYGAEALGRPVQVENGLYGDLLGNIRKAAESTATAAALVIEWSDLDPRLGLRSSGGWAGAARQDIPASVRARVGQMMGAVGTLATRMPVAVAGPSLPLPPIGATIPAQASAFELELHHELSGLLLQLASVPGVRIVHPLNEGLGRLDPKMELLAGFPYTIAYADQLARALSDVLFQKLPKKGLITDLDDTLWAGIVGEIGADAIYWDHANHAQVHGLYQQMLGRLADAGVLLAVASKNEPDVVKAAFARNDLFFDTNSLFPIHASWGPKSKAVEQILATWNINADSVVFVDDNPMELDEVQQAFPGITGLRFSPKDPAQVWELIGKLRELFGKPVLLEEDRLRRESIRASAAIREAGEGATSTEFLSGLQGAVTLDYRKNPADKRPLELINKTNQFNLNGLRVSEGEWQRAMEEPDRFTATISYQDKFGPLGKIGVLVGKLNDDGVLNITNWVMSCRAFSRRIEHHTLHSLLRRTQAQAIEFAFQPTERNQPLQEFFASLDIQAGSSGPCRVSAEAFFSRCGELPHQVSEQTS